MRIAEFIRYYSLSELADQHLNEHSMPFHQLWNWEYLASMKNEMIEIPPQELSSSTILKQVFMDNINQQKIVLKTKSDLFYAPFMGDAYFIALMKCLHLCRTPLVAIAQDTWALDKTTSWRNKIKYAFLRYIVKHGVDKLLFISKGVYDGCKDYFCDVTKQIPLENWGVDLDYYDNYIARQQETPTNNYVFVTGGANRDFVMMHKLSKEESLALPIVIQTNRCPEYIEETKKLKIDKTPKTWDDLLSGYYNSAAVAVPLEKDLSYLSGITVVLEGMACKKPILSTESFLYPFDIEKERIGISLPFGDTAAWKQAIAYIQEHPDEAKEMGERGRYIIEHKHNYKLFCEELQGHIRVLEHNKCKKRHS